MPVGVKDVGDSVCRSWCGQSCPFENELQLKTQKTCEEGGCGVLCYIIYARQAHPSEKRSAKTISLSAGHEIPLA